MESPSRMSLPAPVSRFAHRVKGVLKRTPLRPLVPMVGRGLRLTKRAAIIGARKALRFAKLAKGKLVRLTRLGLKKAHNAYYFVARLFVHQLFRGVFEDDIAAWKPDVVHTHDGMSLALGASLGKRLGVKTVFDSHELEAHRNPPLGKIQRWNVERIEKTGLRQMTAVTTVGHAIADHLRDRYNIARPEVLYNAPPMTPRPLPEKWQQPGRGNIREEADVPDSAVLLVYTGNLTMNRGLEQTLDGMAEYFATQSDPRDVHLSMVGKARPETRDAVNALAVKHKLEDRIHFHEPVSPTSVVDFIGNADIAIIPVIPAALSYEYAMPNKLFESMLAGLPILGARLFEMSRFIEENDLGVCYDPHSATELAAGLADLLSDDARFAEQAERMKQRAPEFSWEAQEAKLLNIYDTFGYGETKGRVAMVVPNPCNPDFRVVKQAEALAAAGHTVRLYCTRPSKSDLPDTEVINDVEYKRLDWAVRPAADNFVRFSIRRMKARFGKSAA